MLRGRKHPRQGALHPINLALSESRPKPRPLVIVGLPGPLLFAQFLGCRLPDTARHNCGPTSSIYSLVSLRYRGDSGRVAEAPGVRLVCVE